jgi:hypothetical protein
MRRGPNRVREQNRPRHATSPTGGCAMYLEDILGSKTKVRILYTMFTSGRDDFFEKELAIECGSSISEVNRQIHFLVEFGLIIFQKKGRLKIYRLNPAHFLYKPLKELFVASVQ